MNQFVLGTAQLGLDYGINNIEGKPSRIKAFDLLNAAYENGVRIIDTAAAYGDAEQIIGMFMKQQNKQFKITTKLQKLGKNRDLLCQIKENLASSLQNLCVSKIDYYLYHSMEDLIDDEEIFKYFNLLKENCQIEKLGVSIYDTYELEEIILNFSDYIDVVQIPFNIFDIKWLKYDLLRKAKEKGIEISVRSVFLQGLLFLDKEKANRINPKTYEYINNLRKLSEHKKITIEELAVAFVKNQKNIDYIIIGCENKTQLLSNIKNFNNDIDFSEKDLEFINTEFANIEKEIINPRMW